MWKTRVGNAIERQFDDRFPSKVASRFAITLQGNVREVEREQLIRETASSANLHVSFIQRAHVAHVAFVPLCACWRENAKQNCIPVALSNRDMEKEREREREREREKNRLALTRAPCK